MKEIMSFLELVPDISEPPQPIIGNGILLPQSLLTIIGAPKVGKSFLVFNLVAAMAAGIGFACFYIDKRYKTLILSAEGGYYPNRHRIRRITKGFDKNELENAYFSSNINLYIDNDEHYDSIVDYIGELDIDVLIIDPLIRFHHQDENSSTGMSQVMSLIRQLIHMTGVSIILVHHTGKQVSRGGRGSSVITGEYDSAIYMTKRCNGVELSFDMRHVKTPENVSLQFNPETFWFEEITASAPERENPVVAHLKQSGPMKQSDLVRDLMNHEVGSSSSAYRWVDSAKKDEKIKENNGMLELVE